MPIVPPWERQPTETVKAYAAFCVYRDLGPNRTVLAAYQQATGRGTAKYPSGGWTAWTARYRWTERADAWDVEQERVIRVETQKARVKAAREMSDRHASISLMFQQKVIEKLQQMDASELTPIGMSRMLEVAAKLERLSRGEPSDVAAPTEIDPAKLSLLGQADLAFMRSIHVRLLGEPEPEPEPATP